MVVSATALTIIPVCIGRLTTSDGNDRREGIARL
jgi:hypothetical protein